MLGYFSDIEDRGNAIETQNSGIKIPPSGFW
jgi:hypothetical protein